MRVFIFKVLALSLILPITALADQSDYSADEEDSLTMPEATDSMESDEMDPYTGDIYTDEEPAVDEEESGEKKEQDLLQSLSNVDLGFGVGFIMPQKALADHVGTGLQTSVFMQFPLMQLLPKSLLRGKMGYSYTDYKKGLAAPANLPARPIGRLNQHNYELALSADYPIMEELSAYLETGALLQRRVFTISSKELFLGDDYYARWGYGFVMRLGLDYNLMLFKHKFFTQVHCNYENGSKMATARLNYGDTSIDINAAKVGFGFNLGYRF